ncbi:MAG: SLC13 family permease [Muricauda sp.]|nr:SLC13 family permease [Allomuricauda sp.]MAU25911.1 SLC13 family permease [Allomuricauda sp.]MBC30347.1 SLC13 family permease [Allomuricauda sp.]|tara:strand:- start:41490 stop:43313 length:1824 start_codon:yes stop_codon:yes gene_type:complete
MTWEIALVFAIIITVIVLFAFEVFPMDKIAFCLIGVLVLTGLVSPEEGISGFSNTAVITILCLMILAAALEQNGVISWMANGLKRFKGLPILFLVPLFMLITGSISAFISSTAVVIVFIKIITELSDKHDIPKSKLLLPISYASILGGSCTLMGTSTNLIVNSIYTVRTGERFSFFEFSWMGVLFMLIAIIVVAILVKLLPSDSKEKLVEQYDVDDYIVTIELAPKSKLIGKPLSETFLGVDQNITVLKLTREGSDNVSPNHELTLKAHDRIMLSCDFESLLRLKSNHEFILNPNDAGEGVVTRKEFKDVPEPQSTQNLVLVELMMLPGARFLEMTLKELQAAIGNGAVPLAIKKRKNLRHIRERIYRYNPQLTRLKVGDRVLVEIDKEKIGDFDLYENIAILQQYEAPEIAQSKNRNLTLGILILVVILAATGTFTILTSAIVGCVLLLLSNCIELENVYKRINWQILFLLAGMIPLGVAMHNTGADDWLTDQLLGLITGQRPVFSIGILFLSTMLLSGVVSNNATAIIMTPIAISLASGMQLPAKPFVLSVLFAANYSFFTPVGYQTNALIYSMGLYRFRHFLIIGGAISILLWLLATYLLSLML